VSVQDRYMVCARHSIGLESFWTHSMEPIGDESQVEAHFGHFGESAILTQDTCMVCIERTIGS
jgi:hypothetical protein